MLYIDVPDMNDSMVNISIDDKEFVLRFTYNEKYDYWSFGIYDEDENPIVAMTRIVPGFDLLHYYSDVDLPDGVFGCLSDSENVGREAFNERTAEFVFMSNEEIEALKEE